MLVNRPNNVPLSAHFSDVKRSLFLNFSSIAVSALKWGTLGVPRWVQGAGLCNAQPRSFTGVALLMNQ